MRTIAALSTAVGMAAIAVIRVSGLQAGEAVRSLAGPLPTPRRAVRRSLRHPGDGAVLDDALVLWFPGPHSFTGEDLAEFHVHGGRAVISAVLSAILQVPGVVLAGPGEFTRRAFENGRLDLAAVEGLADLLAAETEAQRRQAMTHYSGAMAEAVESIRDGLIGAQALVEATIDFPDEGDVAETALVAARERLDAVKEEVGRLLDDSRRGRRIREGLTVAVAGPPNAGKSTLINALAQRDVAIVSSRAGTTRDVLEVHLDLGGAAVVLLDMAGLRDSDDEIEQEGVRRARRRIAEADLVLWLSDEDQATADPSVAAADAAVWSIRTQIDRLPPSSGSWRHRISSLTGEGLDGLIRDLADFAAQHGGGEPALIVRERHLAVFREVNEALSAALARPDWLGEAELVAEDLRAAVAALGRATGRIGAEQMLDALFSSFCIGK
ncbi:tRNA uridine-5-carboxymethylaminomethyl(34) synthesis GTPase MnmE [Phreatobacter sp.]|uniref:tRNA uridine-5-carboxymethylaminomethyl(34) synthesis GTPase MnmE n=1 Tax=Phreatobacter sp. TaxID=1966341 RepID=UPI003F6EB5E6